MAKQKEKEASRRTGLGAALERMKAKRRLRARRWSRIVSKMRRGEISPACALVLLERDVKKAPENMKVGVFTIVGTAPFAINAWWKKKKRRFP